MLISLTIIIALCLSWLTKKLIQRYPLSPHPRRLERLVRPLVNLAEKLILTMRVKIKSLSKQKSAP